MDRDLVSAHPHGLEYLARKHGTSVAKIKEIIKQTGSRSRKIKTPFALEVERAIRSRMR